MPQYPAAWRDSAAECDEIDAGSLHIDAEWVGSAAAWIGFDASRVPMEKLYFPREVTDGLVYKWDPTPVLELLALRRASEKRAAPEPRRAPRVPGRNEPCTCGSGKKYKKCCGG